MSAFGCGAPEARTIWMKRTLTEVVHVACRGALAIQGNPDTNADHPYRSASRPTLPEYINVPVGKCLSTIPRNFTSISTLLTNVIHATRYNLPSHLLLIDMAIPTPSSYHSIAALLNIGAVIQLSSSICLLLTYSKVYLLCALTPRYL